MGSSTLVGTVVKAPNYWQMVLSSWNSLSECYQEFWPPISPEGFQTRGRRGAVLSSTLAIMVERVCLVWMEVSVLGFSMRRFTWGVPLRIKTARRKVASPRQFIKAKVHFQGGRVGRVPRWERAPWLCGDWILLCLSGLGGVVTNSGVVSHGGCFQSFQKLPPQLRRGCFWPYKVCINCLGSLSPWRGLSPQCKCIIRRQGLPWGRGGKGELMFLICGSFIYQPQGLRSHKVRILSSWAFNV